MEVAAEAFTHERTRRLNREKEKLESNERRQELFVASLSHDLRNPLATALMGIEALEMD